MTEQKLRTVFAIGQWSSSWLIAAALVFVVLRITPPEWLAAAVGCVFALTAPTFLVGGMILCVRLPGWRKWVGLTANTFLVLAGVLLMNYEVATSARTAALAEADRIHATEAYKDLASDLAEAKDTRAMWKRRVDGLDPSWVSAAQKPAAELATAEQNVRNLREKLEAMEPTIPTLGAAVSLEGWSGWLALILAVSNEAVALSLMWGAGASVKPQVHKEDGADRAEGAQSAHWDDEERAYLLVRQQLVAAGRPAGYREVAESGGLNLGWCKRVVAKIQKKVNAARRAAA